MPLLLRQAIVLDAVYAKQDVRTTFQSEKCLKKQQLDLEHKNIKWLPKHSGVKSHLSVLVFAKKGQNTHIFCNNFEWKMNENLTDSFFSYIFNKILYLVKGLKDWLM